MYERSAIVLERYFDTLLRYTADCNLQDNFENYCNLVQKLEKFQTNYQKEQEAIQEFNDSFKKVKNVQQSQEKLYKKSVTLEYNRNLLFNNVEGKVENTRKGIEKIEADVEKNNEEMKQKKEELIGTLEEYNNKRFELSKCKRYKKMAENDYVNILEASQINFEGITPELIEASAEFAEFDDLEEIIEKLEDNGKGEKIPFNGEVIENVTIFSVDINKKLAEIYLVSYDKMKKILNDIEAGEAKVETYKRYIRGEKAKVDFLQAVKEYIVQFLDYERMTIIHGRKSHNRLMSEACENFKADVVQINNLYELLLKEISGKATQKSYKELYNKSYLVEIEQKEEKFKKEKNRVNLNTATLINSNYWRIEGFKGIYTTFYNSVTEVFGRNVAEFDLPIDSEETSLSEEKINQDEYDLEEEKKEHKVKMPFNIESLEEDYDDYEDYEESSEEETPDEDFDIFGEKYQKVDFYEVTKELLENQEKANKIQKSLKENVLLEEDIPYEQEEEEEDLFRTMKKSKKDEEEEEDLFKSMKKSKKEEEDEIEDFDLIREPKKTSKTLIKKIEKMNKTRKKAMQGDIW